MLTIKLSKALVLLTGGLGTPDEIFETTTLMQIGKIDPLPVIVLGGKFCNAIRDFVFNTMIKEGVIGEEDLGLLCEASLAEEVVPLIQARMEQILVLGVIGSKKGCQLLLLTEPGCLRLGHKSRKDN